MDRYRAVNLTYNKGASKMSAMTFIFLIDITSIILIIPYSFQMKVLIDTVVNLCHIAKLSLNFNLNLTWLRLALVLTSSHHPPTKPATHPTTHRESSECG